MAHQQGEQSPLAPSQIEQSPVGPYLSGRRIEYDAAGLHRRVMHHLGTSQKGTDAGQQFHMAEGLDHVVVGPAVEAGNTVVDSRARRDHEDRRVATGRSQVLNQRNAVTIGKAEIDDEHGIVDGRRRSPSVRKRFDGIHDEVGIAQALAQQFLQSEAVLYQKQFHDDVAPRVTTGNSANPRGPEHIVGYRCALAISRTSSIQQALYYSKHYTNSKPPCRRFRRLWGWGATTHCRQTV